MYPSTECKSSTGLFCVFAGYTPEIKLSPVEINKQALQCNEKKTNSKRVQEMSVDLYFSVFVKVILFNPNVSLR